MDTLFGLTTIMIVLELLELFLHQSATLDSLLDKLYHYYKKSVFLFFLMHPTFYFVLIITLYLNVFNFYMILIFIFKTFDIFFKLEMIKQRYIIKNMDSELEEMLNLQLNPLLRYFSVIVYVPLFFIAIADAF